MGYVIECYAPESHGKTSTIKAFCDDLESRMKDSPYFRLLYTGSISLDIHRAYKYYGLLIFVVSAGDAPEYITKGYNLLQESCGGLNSDIFICAVRDNKSNDSVHLRARKEAAKNIARDNGHWLEEINIRHLYNEDEDHVQKIKALSDFFEAAASNISRIKTECRITDIT